MKSQIQNQIVIKGVSGSFHTFNDQRFSQHKKHETNPMKANRKIIKALNIYTGSDVQPQYQKYSNSPDLNSSFQFPKNYYSLINKLQPQHHTLSEEQIKIKQSNEIKTSLKYNKKQTCSSGSRYHRSANEDIKIDQKQIDDNGLSMNGRIRVLKKILEQYHTKVMEPHFKSNLINKCSVHFNADSTENNRIINFKKSAPKQTVRREITTSKTKRRQIMKRHKNSSIKSAEVFQSYYNQNRILVEAHGMNELIKLNTTNRKRVNQSANDQMRSTPQKVVKKPQVHPHIVNKTIYKHETLPTEKLRSFENNQNNCIITKVNKFKQFIFMINLTHKVYRQLDIQKYEQPLKLYIGRGNNRNLIKAIMKKRFWFQLTKNIEEANFIWTQLKEQKIYQKQIDQFSMKKSPNRKLKQIKYKTQRDNEVIVQQCQEQLVLTKHTVSQQFSLQESCIKNSNIIVTKPLIRKHKQLKNKKTRQNNNQELPTTRVLTKHQQIHQKQLMHELQHRKNKFFSDRLPLLNNVRTIQLQQMTKQLIHNHLPANGLLGNKKAMFYMLREYYRLTHKDIFKVVPLTYHIRKAFSDDQFKLLATKFIQNRISGIPNYWVIKPGQFSNRGQGIQCTNTMEDIKNRITKIKNNKNKSLIVQQYITNPLLYHGRKFDIRTYMLVSVNNQKIRGYWYQDGYVRTSSYLWSLQDINDNQIHLTNDAIQKYSINYGKYQLGNKLTYHELQRYLDSLPRNGCTPFNFQRDIYPKIKQIAADAIKSSFCYIDPQRKGNNFEIFGFDFMIDAKFNPWLIEINTNPCLQMNCPVLNRFIPSMLENAFRVGLDPIFPPPLNYSCNYKYSIPENALHYNKFELIFDEERDGPALRQLYRDSNILKQMDDYEEDKQIYEEEGEEIDLQQNI